MANKSIVRPIQDHAYAYFLRKGVIDRVIDAPPKMDYVMPRIKAADVIVQSVVIARDSEHAFLFRQVTHACIERACVKFGVDLGIKKLGQIP